MPLDKVRPDWIGGDVREGLTMLEDDTNMADELPRSEVTPPWLNMAVGEDLYGTGR